MGRKENREVCILSLGGIVCGHKIHSLVWLSKPDILIRVSADKQNVSITTINLVQLFSLNIASLRTEVSVMASGSFWQDGGAQESEKPVGRRKVTHGGGANGGEMKRVGQGNSFNEFWLERR